MKNKHHFRSDFLECRATRKTTNEEFVCVCLWHNEGHLLPDFLEHYRSFGRMHFLMVDDHSQDGTYSLLVEQPDVSVFQPTKGSTYAQHKRHWRRDLLDFFGVNRWCIVPDADERLVWRDYESRPFQALVSDLARSGAEAFFCTMVDMYKDGGLQHQVYSGQERLVEEFPYFDDPCKDAQAYRMLAFSRRFRKKWATPKLGMHGGMRDRIMRGTRHAQAKTVEHCKERLVMRNPSPDGFPLARELLMRAFTTKSFKDARQLNVSKVPVLRWKEGSLFNGGAHALREKYVLGDEYGVMLHFPFTKGLDGIQYLAKRAQHAKGGAFYKRALGLADIADLKYWGSSRLTSVGQLAPFFNDSKRRKVKMKPRFRSAKQLFHNVLRSKTVSLDGILLHVTAEYLPRDVANTIKRGTYEFAERHLVKEFVERNDRIVEIGTGVGAVALLAAKIAGEGSVTCYEANPSLQKVIKANQELNKLYPRLVGFPVTSDGRQIEFCVMDNILSSSVFDRGGKPTTLSSLQFSDILLEEKPTTVIMDVEGLEVELLAGDLPGVRKIIVETHAKIVGDEETRKMLDSLKAAGFEQAAFLHKNAVFLR
jgi:FkbM family methyltransferase